jgi:hypothetical protein
MARRVPNILWIPLILAVLMLWGCDPDQDSPDYATVSGWIFTDSTMTQGARDVQIIVESDLESQNPYTGPDQFAWTNDDGHFTVSFYLGHELEMEGGLTHNYIADCRVSYWYEGHMYDWVGGVTVASGKDYILPNVHLGQFQ